MAARYQNAALFCLATFLLGSGPARAESWLTPTEQEFFAALGLEAKVEGKTFKRKADYGLLTDVGNRAPEPLKGRILAIARAFPRLSLSPDEKKQFQDLTLKAAEQMQKELQKTLGAALLSQDSIQRAAEATNAMLKKDGPVRDAWKMQTDWHVREVAAREELAKNMSQITGELEKRSGRTRPSTDLSLALAVEGKTLWVSGKVGATPLTSAVVQVVVHKAKANGALSGLNLASTAWLQSMGVSNMSFLPTGEGGAGAEGAALTAAQEKSFDMPIVKTFGLPKLAAGNRVSIDLDEDLNDVIFFEKVSLKAWTAEGTITLDDLAGLEAAQKYREHVPRDDRFKTPPTTATTKNPAPTATGKTPAGREPFPRSELGGNKEPERKPSAQEERAQAQRQAAKYQQALASLNLARAAIAKKQNDMARVYLNQAITLAPDSPSAKSARTLLKKLDP